MSGAPAAADALLLLVFYVEWFPPWLMPRGGNGDLSGEVVPMCPDYYYDVGL